MNRGMSNGDIQAKIAKGWKPNKYLSNMSMAYFSKPTDYVATRIMPICPVAQSTGLFYTFSKEDLARDNVRRKPASGKVDPAVMGHTENSFNCKVDQIIVGIDQIGTLNYQRANAPVDPRRNKIRFITEQMNIHLDRMFAESYFKSGIWTNQLSGITGSTPGANQFYKFSDANFDPVNFFNQQKRNIRLTGRRTPNKLALGYDAYLALTEHPDVLERVKYTGSTANPAVVTKQVLAQLFGLEEVVVLESTFNNAELGQGENMEFICDSKGALLCYTTNTPAVDEPSAGYIFTWDMLGNGSWIATDQFEGEGGTHTEFIEGLMSSDMRKTADDLACFMADCV